MEDPDKKKWALNTKAMNALYCTLDRNGFNRSHIVLQHRRFGTAWKLPMMVNLKLKNQNFALHWVQECQDEEQRKY